MIKRFNDYIKESLLDELKGPSKNEVINNLKDEPLELYQIGYENADEIIKSEASKLITPKIKGELVEDILEVLYMSMEYYSSDEIDDDSIIYDISGKDWKDYLFSTDLKKRDDVNMKIYNHYMNYTLDELYYWVIEFEIGL